MDSKKGYLTAEFVIVILVFVIILFSLVANFNMFIPSEVKKIRSQTACLEAELLADAMLNFQGNPNNWETLNLVDLTRLGFSTRKFGEVNYSKWATAQNLTYLSTTDKTGFNRSFVIKYGTYAIKTPTSYVNPITKDPEPQEHLVIYFSNSSRIGVFGKNSGSSNSLIANVELFLPDVNIIKINTTVSGSAIEGADSVIATNRSNGATIKIHFGLFNDADQAIFDSSSGPDIVFVRQLEFKDNKSFSKDYPIYFNKNESSPSGSCNPKDCVEYGTLLKDEFGSTGFLDPAKNYCEVKRKLVMINRTHNLGIDISVIAER